MLLPMGGITSHAARGMVMAAVLLCVVGCAGGHVAMHYPTQSMIGWVPAPRTTDGEPNACVPRIPIVFVHGYGGSAKEFDVMIDRLVRDGWPRELLFAKSLPESGRGSNVANARIIGAWVAEARRKTGAAQVDLVAHSMGGLGARYYVQFLDGADVVRSYTSLGTMHNGLTTPCAAPIQKASWKELCTEESFLDALSSRAPSPEDGVRWTSIYGGDDKVTPLASALLPGAAFTLVGGVTHAGRRGLLEHPGSYEALRAALTDNTWTPDGCENAAVASGRTRTHPRRIMARRGSVRESTNTAAKAVAPPMPG